MKILLINLPFQVGFQRRKRYSHLIGLRYIASSLIKCGHEVFIKDYQDYLISEIESEPNDAIKTIASCIGNDVPNDTDLIGISIPFSHSAIVAHQVIKILKRIYDIPIAVGGAYPSSQPELAINSGADYVVIGEGEVPMIELMEYLRGNLTVLPQYIISNKDTIIQPKPYITNDINSLPFPYKNAVDYKSYTKHSQRNIFDTITTSIITSRGCPYTCEFCSIHNINGFRWRAITTMNVLEDIRFLTKNFGIRNYEIEDDNFSYDTSRCADILRGMIKIDPLLTWTAPNGLRIDTITEDLVLLFKKSNCRYAYLALEHGDEKLLNSIICKNLDLEYASKVIGWFGKHEIPCYIFILYGYPGETHEAFRESVRYCQFLRKINPGVEFSFMLPEPYPGTGLFKRAIQEGWVSASVFKNPYQMYRYYSQPGPWIITPELSEKEISSRGRKLFEEFKTPQTYVEGITKYPPMTDM